MLSARKLWTNSRSRLSGYARRFSEAKSKEAKDKNRETAQYMGVVVALVFGLSYASVPLYKVFCQMTGFGGTGIQKTTEDKAITVKPADGSKILTVSFKSSVPDTMPWTFVPTQNEVKIIPGETALAFYTARNNSDKAIIGVATYNVIPPKAALYFNKIQCFCFEEQRLEPQEEIDMPVFFFIDPAMLDDPALKNINSIVLSYTFFKTGEEEIEAPASHNTAASASAGATVSATVSTPPNLKPPAAAPAATGAADAAPVAVTTTAQESSKPTP